MKITIRNPEHIVCFLEDYVEERFYKAFFSALKTTIDDILTSSITEVEKLDENDCIFLHFLPIYLSGLNITPLNQNEVSNLFRTGFKIDNVEVVKSEFLQCIKPYLIEIEEAENHYKTSFNIKTCNVVNASLSNVTYELLT